MIRYYLRVEATSPISITSHQTQAGQPNPTLDYVPGTTLRGALAWRHLRRPGASSADPSFQALFDKSGLWCGPLLPIGYEGDHVAGFALPLPLTARTCKRHEGFRGEPQLQRRGHGVIDTLVAAIEETFLIQARQEGQPAPADLGGLEAVTKCSGPGCDAPLERVGGRYEFGKQGDRRWARRVAQRQTLMSHTALLEDLQVAKPGALFSRQALERGQQLAGFLDVDPAAEEYLLETLQVGSDLVVGAGRTSGLGRLQVLELSKAHNPLAAMLGNVQTRYAAFARLLPRLPDDLALVPITLLTDTVLLDPWLRPAVEPAPKVRRGRERPSPEGNLRPSQDTDLSTSILKWYARLACEAGTEPPPAWPDSLGLFLGVAQTHRVASWNTAGSARPRSDDVALAAGSVFVLSAPTQEKDALLAAAAWLESNGLGERREEGFGQIVVAHPFHAEVTPL